MRTLFCGAAFLRMIPTYVRTGWAVHAFNRATFNEINKKMKTLIKSINRSPLRCGLLTLAIALCFALIQNTQAVNPPPDGGYPGANTAEGTDALFSLTSGIANTAVGLNALHDNTTGGFNVAVGSSALAHNVTGNFNMAIGTDALTNNNSNFNLAIGFRVGFMNTTGNHLTGIGAAALRNNTTGGFNTAIGADAMRENTTAGDNTTIGAGALTLNTTTEFNVAVGDGALASFNGTTATDGANTALGSIALTFLTSGEENVAVGRRALESLMAGSNNVAVGWRAGESAMTTNDNVAIGWQALAGITTSPFNTAVGSGAMTFASGGAGFNTAVGYNALMNATANANVAIGDDTLINTTSGFFNTAIGAAAGDQQTTGHNNIYIGQGSFGVAGESNTCYIQEIFGQPGGTQFVAVNSAGKLGFFTSSRRFKDEIKPIDQTSELIYTLKPVSFRYKKEIEPSRPLSFGLIAEDVEKVSPDLVQHGADGKVSSVRYECVNAMLLNEFLKEHKKVEEQQASIAELKSTVAVQRTEMQVLTAQLKEQAAQIEKVSAQLEVSKPTTKVVTNKP